MVGHFHSFSATNYRLTQCELPRDFRSEHKYKWDYLFSEANEVFLSPNELFFFVQTWVCHVNFQLAWARYLSVSPFLPFVKIWSKIGSCWDSSYGLITIKCCSVQCPPCFFITIHCCFSMGSGVWTIWVFALFLLKFWFSAKIISNHLSTHESRHQNNVKSVWNAKIVVVMVREQMEGEASGFADLWIAEVKAFSIWIVFVTKKEP